MYYVYLIITKIKNNYISYVGSSNNVKKRLIKHNTSKGAKFTRGKYWEIIYKKKYETKSKALKEEYKLKKNIKKRKEIKIKFITKYEKK